MLRLGRTLCSLLLLLILPASGAAQMPPGPPTLASGTGIIVGQVLDAATGKGVNSAVVTLAGARRAMTTADGRFVFRNLPEGSHHLSAAKSGYLDAAVGMRRPGGTSLPVVLAAAERRGGVVIWLWRHGSISGTIVDEAGEPLVGIQMTAMRRLTIGGRRRFRAEGSAMTDDRGAYRIGRLTPGDYAVAMTTTQVSVPSATVKQLEDMMMAGDIASRGALLQSMSQIGGISLMAASGSARQVGDQTQSIGIGAPTPPPGDGPRLFAYPSVFYPAAPSTTAATIVTVVSAQERTGIDLQVKPVPMVRVSGVVTGATASAANIPIRLTAPGSDDFGRSADVGGTLTDANGNFTFLAVPAGDYVLRIVQIPRAANVQPATTAIALGSGMMVMTGAPGANPEMAPIPAEPTLWATVPVAVGETDVTGMNVVLRTGLKITGHIEFEGATEKPAPDQLSRIPVMVEPFDGPMDRMGTPPGRIDVKGQFSTYGLAAGRYYVRAGAPPKGWTFKGAFVGERNVADVPLDLDSNDIADVKILFTDRAASLSGTVQMTERAARDGVAVVIFPADAKAWPDAGLNPRRLRRVAVTDTGAYDVASLPAGTYFVAAVSESAAGDWQDPAFLEQLAATAAQVQIDDGEKATQSLRIQEVR